MRFQGLALAAALLASLLARPAMADDENLGPLNPRIIPGVVLSAGRAETTHNGTGVGSGIYVDANYTRTFVNIGTDYQQYGSNVRVLNGFAGVGFSRLIQLQAGYGNDGTVTRLRSDFNFAAILAFFSGSRRNRYDQTLGQRFTFTISTDRYNSQPRLDNFHIGFGLLY